MGITKITRNNQVTLPAEIRKKLGVKEGDYIEILDVNGFVTIKKLENKRKVIKLGKKLTSNEINNIILKGMKKCL